MAHARLKIARSVAASADIYSGTHCAPWTRAMAAKAASLEDVTAKITKESLASAAGPIVKVDMDPVGAAMLAVAKQKSSPNASQPKFSGAESDVYSFTNFVLLFKDYSKDAVEPSRKLELLRDDIAWANLN